MAKKKNNMTGNAYVDAAIEALKQVTEDEDNDVSHIFLCNVDGNVILSFNNDSYELTKMLACALYKSKTFRAATEAALRIIHYKEPHKGDFVSDFTNALDNFTKELDILGKKYNIKTDEEEEE